MSIVVDQLNQSHSTVLLTDSLYSTSFRIHNSYRVPTGTYSPAITADPNNSTDARTSTVPSSRSTMPLLHLPSPVGGNN